MKKLITSKEICESTTSDLTILLKIKVATIIRKENKIKMAIRAIGDLGFNWYPNSSNLALTKKTKYRKNVATINKSR